MSTSVLVLVAQPSAEMYNVPSVLLYKSGNMVNSWIWEVRVLPVLEQYKIIFDISYINHITKLRGKSKGKCLTSSRWHIYKSVRCYFSRSGGEAYFNSSKISIGEGSGSPLQYSCLENPMDRGAWWVTVHGVAKSRTRLSAQAKFPCTKEEMRNLDALCFIEVRESVYRSFMPLTWFVPASCFLQTGCPVRLSPYSGWVARIPFFSLVYMSLC